MATQQRNIDLDLDTPSGVADNRAALHKIIGYLEIILSEWDFQYFNNGPEDYERTGPVTWTEWRLYDRFRTLVVEVPNRWAAHDTDEHAERPLRITEWPTVDFTGDKPCTVEPKILFRGKIKAAHGEAVTAEGFLYHLIEQFI